MFYGTFSVAIRFSLVLNGVIASFAFTLHAAALASARFSVVLTYFLEQCIFIHFL